MDSARPARIARHRPVSRPRRMFRPMGLEALEGRRLLSTAPLKDINPAPRDPADITGAGGNVYFVTRAADGGSNLEVRTAAGTKVLKEFHDPSGSDSATEALSDLTVVGSRLFFVVDGTDLWVTDGTNAGTRLVKDRYAGAGEGNPADLTAVGNELFFTARVTQLDFCRFSDRDYRSTAKNKGFSGITTELTCQRGVQKLPPGLGKPLFQAIFEGSKTAKVELRGRATTNSSSRATAQAQAPSRRPGRPGDCVPVWRGQVEPGD